MLNSIPMAKKQFISSSTASENLMLNEIFPVVVFWTKCVGSNVKQHTTFLHNAKRSYKTK